MTGADHKPAHPLVNPAPVLARAWVQSVQAALWKFREKLSTFMPPLRW